MTGSSHRLLLSTVAYAAITSAAWAQQAPHDPGVRGGPPGAGAPFAGLSPKESKFFNDGLAAFLVVKAPKDGLGPRFNLNQCAGCHDQPNIGGTSPAQNPAFAVATLMGASNKVPLFISPSGPIREARLKFQVGSTEDRPLPDNGVHDLFVITGRTDAAGCNIAQEDLDGQNRKGNVSFRIPTPVFGAGLIEAIPDATILANQAANAAAKSSLGIAGFPNRNGNDGTITRFGWKAQNKSLLLFSGEAYNVEMGISSDLFTQKRDETPSCQFQTLPNDDIVTTDDPEADDVELFAAFMRLLDQPTPSTTVPGGADSITSGKAAFREAGCNLCHKPTFVTASNTLSPAQGNVNANLFSDLLIHHMGPKLADGITQGLAPGDGFRTSPLWGLGQRIFFLHDGRTNDLLQAILAHASAGNNQFGPSEANGVVAKFSSLPPAQQQNLLNFLRSL